MIPCWCLIRPWQEPTRIIQPTRRFSIKYNAANFVPVFMEEANYEFEDNTGMDYGDPETLRKQEYWTMLSGATGQLYGNHYTWTFESEWEQNLNTPGIRQL